MLGFRKLYECVIGEAVEVVEQYAPELPELVDLKDYDLVLRSDVIGLDPETARKVFWISTKHDPSVGIWGVDISPSFHSVEELVKWWNAHKAKVKDLMGRWYDGEITDDQFEVERRRLAGA